MLLTAVAMLIGSSFIVCLNKSCVVEGLVLLSRFLEAIQADPRIGANHISLYATLIQFGYTQNCYMPVTGYRKEFMAKAKILGRATYHKYMNDLNEFGYINYVPSYNHRKKSKIFLINIGHRDKGE